MTRIEALYYTFNGKRWVEQIMHSNQQKLPLGEKSLRIFHIPLPLACRPAAAAAFTFQEL